MDSKANMELEPPPAKKLKLSLPVISWVQKLWDCEEGFERFLDVTINVGNDHTFKAHKNVLAPAIPFFKEMFTSETKEAVTGEVYFQAEVIPPEGLEAVLKVVYGQEVEITDENVEKVLTVATAFKLESVSDRCAEFMKENLNFENVVSFWHYAHLPFPGSQELVELCCTFIIEHFPEIYRSEQFANLAVGSVSDLLSFPLSDNNELLDAIVGWLNKDWDTRYRNADILSKLVLWEKVDYTKSFQLGSVTEFRGRTCTGQPQKDAQLELLKKLAGPPAEQLSVGMSPPLSVGDTTDTEQREIYCLRKGDDGQYLVRTFDTETSSWDEETKLPGPPFDRIEATGYGRVIKNMKMFRYDGVPFMFLDTSHIAGFFLIQRLEGEKCTITHKLADPSPRSDSGSGLVVTDVSVDGNDWLCVALNTAESVLSKILVYQINGKMEPDSGVRVVQPTKVLDLSNDSSPAKRTEASMVVFSGDIYIVGGCLVGGSKHTIDVHIFNLASDSWRTGPKLRHCIRYPTLVATAKRLILSGGDCAGSVQSAVAYLTQNASRWTYLPPMNVSRSKHQMVVAGNCIHVFGGLALSDSNPNFHESFELDNEYFAVWQCPEKPREIRKGFMFAV